MKRPRPPAKPAPALEGPSFADRLRALRENQFRNVKVTAPRRKKPSN